MNDTIQAPLDHILDAMAEAVLVVDFAGQVIGANRRAHAMFGYPPDEMRGLAVEQLIPPRFRARHLQQRTQFAREAQARMMGSQSDLFALRRNGSEFPVEVGLGPMREGKERYTIVSVVDTSERKDCEYQAQWCEAIVNHSSDAIIGKTLDGIVSSWNASAEALFGYPAAEMVGQPLLILFPEDRLNEEESILARIRQGEPVEHFETVRLRKDGSPVDVSVSTSPIRNRRGEIIGASKIVRDISAWKRKEKTVLELSMRLADLLQVKTSALETTEDSLKLRTIELARTLARQAESERLKVEEERRHLSLELHDEIGQMLTALNFNLERLRRKAQEDELAQSLGEAIRTTEAIVRGVRRIVHQLRPPQLDEFGLIPAIRWHIDTLLKSCPLHIALEENLGQRRFPRDAEIASFRIVQESLSNVLRHASASRVDILLCLEADELRLAVTDNGVGFDWPKASRNAFLSGRMGLRGIRERALGMGGHFSLQASPGQGCRIEVRLPLNALDAES
jgi:PAS domain S-box-containing protein